MREGGGERGREQERESERESARESARERHTQGGGERETRSMQSMAKGWEEVVICPNSVCTSCIDGTCDI